MNEPNTGKLLPGDQDKAKVLLEAFATLEHSAAFKEVVARVEERLKEIDIANRRRGQENQCTEAQAWEWFLATAEKAKTKGDVKVIKILDK
jgi:hypothetical protein